MISEKDFYEYLDRLQEPHRGKYRSCIKRIGYDIERESDLTNLERTAYYITAYKVKWFDDKLLFALSIALNVKDPRSNKDFKDIVAKAYGSRDTTQSVKSLIERYVECEEFGYELKCITRRLVDILAKDGFNAYQLYEDMNRWKSASVQLTRKITEKLN